MAWQMRASAAVAALAAAAAVSLAAPAAEARSCRAEGPGTGTTIVDNDWAAGRNRDYTAGIYLTYVTGPDEAPKALRGLARSLFGASMRDCVRAGIAFGQTLHTPGNLQVLNPPLTDRPYAAHLFVEGAIYVEGASTLDIWRVQLGTTGEPALGESAQNNAHAIFGGEEARGWDTQIEAEPTLGLGFDRIWRWNTRLTRGRDGLELGMLPGFGVTLGNAMTEAHASLTLRLGENLRNDFGPPRIRPGLAGAPFFSRADGFSWYVFAGGEFRGVAQDITLDGPLFSDGGRSVERKPAVGEAWAGLVVQIEWFQAGAAFVYRTKEFQTQDEDHMFGSFFVSLNY